VKNQTRGFLHDHLEINHDMFLVHHHIESPCSHIRGAFRNAEVGGSRVPDSPSRCPPRLADGSEVREMSAHAPRPMSGGVYWRSYSFDAAWIAHRSLCVRKSRNWRLICLLLQYYPTCKARRASEHDSTRTTSPHRSFAVAKSKKSHTFKFPTSL